jgi:hypothetical protein
MSYQNTRCVCGHGFRAHLHGSMRRGDIMTKGFARMQKGKFHPQTCRVRGCGCREFQEAKLVYSGGAEDSALRS